MTKETKKKLIIGFIALAILGMFLPDIPSQEVKKEEVKKPVKERNYSKQLKKDLDLITDLQDHFYNKPLTKEMLNKYPSFNEITKDFRQAGGNTYYIYSKKHNIELKVQNGEVVMLWEGSRFKN
jgi:hypothetical protein